MRLRVGYLLAVVVAAAAACIEAPTAPPVLPDPEVRLAVRVENNPFALAAFVERGYDAGVPIVGDGEVLTLRAPSVRDNISFQLEAVVAPPAIDGVTLQATDIAFSETDGTGSTRYAYVTYATAGDATLGAVDVIEVRDGENAELVSRALFTDADVNAAAVADDRLYLATSSSDERFAERAVLEVVVLQDGRLPAPYASLRLQLPSFAGTSVHVQNDRVWAVSGSGGPNVGGLSVFRAADLAPLGTVALDDARGVGGSAASGVVVVAHGAPGRASVFGQGSQAAIGSPILTGGAMTPEARGDVFVDGAWALVAASEGGSHLLRVGSTGGTLRLTIPLPTGPNDPPGQTVNGITTHRDGTAAWIFTANGAGGVYAYYSDYPSVGTGTAPSAQLIGRLTFPAFVSANFAKADAAGEWLAVASGLGGLRLIEINN